MAAEERFPRSHRITHRNDFLRIQSGGKRFRSQHLLLVVLPRKGLRESGLEERPELSGQTRLGITITTRIDKRAARRNRLKRRIREIFRREYRFLLPGWDLVVIALSDAAALNFPAVRAELLWLLRKARLYSAGARRRQDPA